MTSQCSVLKVYRNLRVRIEAPTHARLRDNVNLCTELRVEVGEWYQNRGEGATPNETKDGKVPSISAAHGIVTCPTAGWCRSATARPW